jgi:D-alanyl-D-alanine dipeptidase
MMTPERDSVGKPHPFALGFHVNELDGHRRIGHGGAVYGCATQLEILPEQQLGVAAVAALDCANGTVERLVNYALRLLLATRQNKPLPTYARTQPVPESRAKSLVGTYRHENSVVEIRYLDNRLMLQRGVLQNELRLEPTSGEIMVDDVLAHGTTVRSAADGQLSIQDKLYAPVAEGPPPAPPQIWEGLIGEYGWDHNTLYILEYHGHLVALIEWFYAYPLTQLGPDEYAFPDYGLYHGEKLVFQRGSQGLATQVIAAEVPFLRRSVGTFQGKTFKIEPLRPVERLRAEAAAAEPPKEAGDFRDSQLTELKQLVPDLALDIRYATTNNFVGSVFYDAPQAFLQRPAAEAVARVDSRLRQQRLGLLIHDAYRPWFVTKMFWEATPDGMKDFVANPATGSRHNRGCAVDLSLIDLAKQQPIEMVSGYDEFSQRAFPNYPGGTTRQRWYRDLLRTAMESEGFNVYQFEWWHFDFADWKKYRLENKTFDQIR